MNKFAYARFLAFGVFGVMVACSAPRENTDLAVSEPLSLQERAALDSATFAGGCFWCVEAALEQIKGVRQVVSGYSGGSAKDATYQQVSAGRTDHAEAVRVYYDPEVIDFATLLDIFFVAHDPTQLNRQGPDVGRQYRSAIFTHSAEQQQAAQQKIRALDASGKFKKPIVTEVQPVAGFYLAEDYHQNYAAKHPNDSYIRRISMPKIRKVQEQFPEWLKPATSPE